MPTVYTVTHLECQGSVTELQEVILPSVQLQLLEPANHEEVLTHTHARTALGTELPFAPSTKD